MLIRLISVAAALLLIACGDGDGRDAGAEPGAAPAGPTMPAAGDNGRGAGGGSMGPVVLIGDSLAEEIAPLLPAAVGAKVSIDAEWGRSLASGMELVRRAPSGARLAVSLFTNDDPRAVETFERAVRESVGVVGSSGCAVWATIVRPPFDGVSYEGINHRLRSLAADPSVGPRLRIVEWERAVADNPSWLTGDEVHPTAAGNRGLAALYAEALRTC